MSTTRGIMSNIEWRSFGGRVIGAFFLVVLLIVRGSQNQF